MRLWCVLGLALYLWAAWSGGVQRQHLLFLAVAPGVAVNVFFGQNGFVTAALLIGGLANLDRKPVLAGVLFGILTIKPQFGLLLPVLLVMTGRWRVIAAAVVTTAVLVALTSLWFGGRYLARIRAQSRAAAAMADDRTAADCWCRWCRRPSSMPGWSACRSMICWCDPGRSRRAARSRR